MGNFLDQPVRMLLVHFLKVFEDGFTSDMLAVYLLFVVTSKTLGNQLFLSLLVVAKLGVFALGATYEFHDKSGQI